eukprot:scaffold4545_cov103-Alexandrium_tamarense.AAC.24
MMTATHQMYQPLLLIWRFDPLNELCADFGLDDWSLLATPGIRRLIARVGSWRWLHFSEG